MKRLLLALLLAASGAQASGVFVAVSTETGATNAESLATGTTWAGVNTGTALALSKVAYGNGIFCAVGAGSLTVSYKSLDGGATWSIGGSVGGGSAVIGYVGGVFTVWDSGINNNFTSPDCATWTATGASVSGSFAQYAAYDSVHGVLIMTISSNPGVITTPNGAAWTYHANVLPQAASPIASCGGTTLAAGGSQWGLSSDGGATWSTVHGAGQISLPVGVACSDANHFTVISAGEGGDQHAKVEYFVNPVAGSTAVYGGFVLNPGSQAGGLAWNGAEYVAVFGGTANWAHSLDGHTFTLETTGAVSLATPALAASLTGPAPSGGSACLIGGGIICGNNP